MPNRGRLLYNLLIFTATFGLRKDVRRGLRAARQRPGGEQRLSVKVFFPASKCLFPLIPKLFTGQKFSLNIIFACPMITLEVGK
jgi:hypothetical protein